MTPADGAKRPKEFVMKATWNVILILCLATTTPVFAQKAADPVKALVKDLNAAIGKGDVAQTQAALARATELSKTHPPKKFAPVAAAVGRGVAHKNSAIALASVDALGAMRVRGSSKSLTKLLAPPAKGPGDKRALYVAAIRAAGSIADKGALKALQKCVSHPDKEIAGEAAKAFAGYRAWDEKKLDPLVKSLISSLGKFEKLKGDKKTPAATAAIEGLNESLASLTGGTAPMPAKEWTAYVKKKKKEAKA